MSRLIGEDGTAVFPDWIDTPPSQAAPACLGPPRCDPSGRGPFMRCCSAPEVASRVCRWLRVGLGSVGWWKQDMFSLTRRARGGEAPC